MYGKGLGQQKTGTRRAAVFLKSVLGQGLLDALLERRVPAVAPWRALNLGLLLQITYSVPLRFTIWQSAWRRFIEAKEERTFMVYNSGLVFGSGDGIYRLVKNCKVISLPKVRCRLRRDAFMRKMQ